MLIVNSIGSVNLEATIHCAIIRNKSSSEFIHVYIHYVGLVIDTGSLMLIANVTREVCIIYIHMELYSIQIGVEVLFEFIFSSTESIPNRMQIYLRYS